MSEPTCQEPLDWLNEYVHSSCFDSSPDLGWLESDSWNIARSEAPHMQATGNAEGAIFDASLTEICAECHADFSHKWSLAQHARETFHRSYKCQLEDCNESFNSRGERDSHEKTPHGIGHNRIHSEHIYHCNECQENLGSKANLLRHSQERQHKPYGCSCGILFSRIDVLNRHLKSFATDTPQYPCTFCKRHRGDEGFRRKDHLLQHLKQYHHHEIDATTKTHNGTTKSGSRLKYIFPVCTHSDCPQYRGAEFQQLPFSTKEAQKPFRSQSEFTKHMRQEHNECTFPCDVLGCSRVGRRGYFREKDFIKHRRQEHPEAESYTPSGKATLHQCTEPGCDAVLDMSSVAWHYTMHAYRNIIAQSTPAIQYHHEY